MNKTFPNQLKQAGYSFEIFEFIMWVMFHCLMQTELQFVYKCI